MQITTTVSFPKDLAEEVERQITKGRYASRSDFIRSAVRTYLRFQDEQFSWDVLAAPFRAYAKKKNLTERGILKTVEKGRHVKTFKDSK